MTGRVVVAVATLVLMGMTSAEASAQSPSMGVRVGFGISESSLIFGAHLHAPISSLDGLSFEPVAQIGLGSQDPLDYKIYELAGRMRYDFGSSGDVTRYGFAGLVIYRFSVDVPDTPIGDLGASRSDVGLTFGGGIEKNGFGAEIAIGASVVSSVQVMGRYTLGVS